MAGPAIDVSPKKDGGVLKEVIREGEGGEIVPKGSKVQVHYTGTLLDGTKFDSSRDRGQSFEFTLGRGKVIKAWEIGIATMKKGEQAILTCASEYAYGEAGSPPNIPPNSTLLFDVELLGWKGEDLSPKKDGSIERKLIEAGEGFSTPNDGALVKVHLVGKHGDRIFEERDVTFNLGEGSAENVIEGIEIALEKFKKGETSRLLISSKYAFGSEGNTNFNIPPDAAVEYVVHLETFEKAKESWSFDSADRIIHANLAKDKGTSYFKDGKLNLAVKMYMKALSILEKEKDTNGPQSEDWKKILLAVNLNLCLCYLKLNDYFKARSSASAAINIDHNSEKAHFRRGQALLALGEPQLAAADFKKVLELEPNNQAAKVQHAACSKILKEQLKREKTTYANMFAKFAKMDTQKEEDEKKKQPDVMSSLGEWGKEDRQREPSEFEKENPNILLLNGSGEFKDM